MERRLASVFVADIVGSTPAMEADEEGALVRLNACLQAVSDSVTRHSGRVFNTAGDAILAEFSSPVNALKAAVDARAAVGRVTDSTMGDLRIGVHLADVVVHGDDLRGDGVNLAARIQAGAEPGGIHVSAPLFDQVKRVSPVVFDDLGPRQFKGMSDPIQVYRVRADSDRSRYGIVPTVKPTVPAVRSNSLVVLPFSTASSAAEDQGFLAEGLTDDLTLELSRMRSLFVLSRSAASTTDVRDPVEIGTALGVENVLSGSVRKMGDLIRFNISLSETRTGGIIWSDRVQGKFDDVFDMMDDIAGRVTATVAGRIEHKALHEARLKRPENMSAYECYLRAIDLHRLGGVTDKHVHEALGWYDRALDLDPGFGRAYAMRVCTASYLEDFDMDRADRDTSRALELDPTDPEAHRIMGIIKVKNHRDYAASRHHHDMAVKLAPNDAYILGRCAAFHTFVGEAEKAMELLDRAEALDPFLPVWVTEERCAALYAMDRFEEMLAAASALPYQTRRSRIYMAAALVALDRIPQARAQIREALTGDPALSTDYVISQELYEDAQVMALLLGRAVRAGLLRGAEPCAVVNAG